MHALLLRKMSKSLAESDFMDALGYIAYTLDALKAAQYLLAAFPPDEGRDLQSAGQKLCAVLRRLSKPRGDSPLSLWQESQK